MKRFGLPQNHPLLTLSCKILIAFTGVLIFVCTGAVFYFSIPAGQVLTLSGKAAGYTALSLVYHQDMEKVDALVRTYDVGMTSQASTYPTSWIDLNARGIIQLDHISPNASQVTDQRIPFVYGRSEANYLKRFKSSFKLEKIVREDTSEFKRMLALFNWVGTRWDHGTDRLPGAPKEFDLVQVIEEGEKGRKFWCEIAAELAVHVATAYGWPARLVTLSRDGYTWEHAVAEVWSNPYNKWFVVDTDFNLMYVAEDTPLSAFELCHQGPAIAQKGKLTIVQIAPQKPSLPLKDLIPFYKYIHIDMRNDWQTRKLRRGSPAGGDLSTWWTAREQLPPLLTLRHRVDAQSRFNWPVNFTRIHALKASVTNKGVTIVLGFSGYSPFFMHWQVSIDQKPWISLASSETLPIDIVDGSHSSNHSIRARMALTQGNFGPESVVAFGR